MKYIITSFIVGIIILLCLLYITNKQQKPKIIYKDKLVIKTVPTFKITEKEIANYITLSNQKIFPELATIIAKVIISNSKTFNIPELIIVGIMKKESNFDTFATNKSIAYGLMQVNYKQHKQELIKNQIIKTKNDLFSPTKNIKAGCFILKQKIDLCTKYSQTNTLQKLGYKTIFQCAISKYFGAKGLSYYNQVASNIGDFLIYIYENGEGEDIYDNTTKISINNK